MDKIQHSANTCQRGLDPQDVIYMGDDIPDLVHARGRNSRSAGGRRLR